MDLEEDEPMRRTAFDATRHKSMWDLIESEDPSDYYEPPKFYIIDGRIIEIPSACTEI